MVRQTNEVLVCQNDRTIFEGIKRCRECKGVNCEYLQSFGRGEIGSLKQQGYRWFEKPSVQ